jgi:hypothetical protein
MHRSGSSVRHQRGRLKSPGRRSLVAAGLAGAIGAATAWAGIPAASAATGSPTPFLSHLSAVTNVASTVPANGDVNPYGITVVPQTVGHLVRGDTLVSNFNNSSNAQGTGTTIVEISPSGVVTPFAEIQRPAGTVGLTTALTTLPGGWVVVGNLPTTDGTSATASAGDLIVLNSVGQVAEEWSGHHINGPWDLTAVSNSSRSEIFVSNVLNGTVANSPKTVDGGTVVRLDVALDRGEPPRLVGDTVIAKGFDERTDINALVVGPTGLALGRDGELFVADTVNSRIAAVPDALQRGTALPGGGLTVSSGGALSGPLGLTLAPNGDVLTVNGGNGNIVETTVGGDQVAVAQIDPAGAGGDLFGVALATHHRGVLFVDDGDNTMKLFGRT